MKLVLFDIDGTLLLMKGAGREAQARTMEHFFGSDMGVRRHPYGGKTDWRILSELLTAQGHTPAQVQNLLAPFQDAMAVELERILGDYPVMPCPHAHEVVAALRQRADVLLGLVTGNFGRTAQVKLRACGFDPAWFPVGAFGHESPDRNDLARLALERAAQHLGQTLAAPDVFVIGDTLADVACARAVGAVAVAVQTGFEHADLLHAAAPDYLLPDLTTFFAAVPV